MNRQMLNMLGEHQSIITPDQYQEGQYGFIGAKDIFSKIPEFTSWLIEIHGKSRENLLPREEKKNGGLNFVMIGILVLCQM